MSMIREKDEQTEERRWRWRKGGKEGVQNSKL